MVSRPYTVPPAERVPCVRCATLVHEREADYSPRGEVLCQRCADVADIGDTELRAVARMKAAGYGNLGLGALALVINPLLVFTVLSMANAFVLAGSLSRGDFYRRRMGGHFAPVLASAVAGGVLGAVPVVWWVLILGGPAV